MNYCVDSTCQRERVLPRFKLTIEYDGTDLSGWQRQDGSPTVQQYIEEAVSAYFNTDERFLVQCSGRTDAGVHAYGQVAHVDFPEPRESHSIAQGINYHLKTNQVVVTAAEAVDDEFNARFNAKQRHYEYRIINRRTPLVLARNRAWQIPEPLNVDAMHQAAQLLVGTHDFNSFRDTQCQSNSSIKAIDAITITRDGDTITATLEARSFLHHQVRIIIGSLRLIGNGKWAQDDLLEALKAKNRAAAGETAPAYGLYFMRVDY